MRVAFSIIHQILYFVLVVLIFRERPYINQSPYKIIIWGMFMLGILANAIALYELYQYFATGQEVEFFLGGFFCNLVTWQMSPRNAKKKKIDK